MYFFVCFIIFTFGLLYVFFKMTQNSEEEVAARKAAALKGQRTREQTPTFADIDAIDGENNPYNTYRQATQVTSQFTSASTPFVNLAALSYAKAQ